MSVKRSKLEVPASVEIIRRARAHLKRMPEERKLELMVEAGVMTVEQAERALKNWRKAKAIK